MSVAFLYVVDNTVFPFVTGLSLCGPRFIQSLLASKKQLQLTDVKALLAVDKSPLALLC